jgi:serine protease
MNTPKHLALATLAIASIVAVVACGGGSSATPAATSTEVVREIDKVDQLILKYKVNTLNGETISAAEAARLSAIAGITILPFRAMSDDAHVVKLASKITIQAAQDISAKLLLDPLLLYVELDRIMVAHQSSATPPTDPQYVNQWSYAPVTGSPGAANVVGAWNTTTGQAPTVVAIIDTGILQHNDLVGHILPGYDFVSDTANGDGGGRDSDPTDPGDSHYEIKNGVSTFIASSWHGTRVAGIIGATPNNGLGMVGINWNTKILPIRALGKQGGLPSDIQDAIRWAVGLPIAGVPLNSNPAKVINMSIGSYDYNPFSSGACPSTMQSAINAVISKGATIIVSSGNEYGDVARSTPANCNGVISVGSNNQYGHHANYSNFGTGLSISAPGGYLTDPMILSTSDGGTTTALNNNIYEDAMGTSFAAPHVTGIVSLMYSMVPTLNSAVVKPLIVSSARAFPAGTSCLVHPALIGKCGSGILDGGAAMNAFKNSNAFCAAQNPPTC